MNWTEDQRKIIEARDCNLLVSAAAGSGKTAVLVERIIQMISDRDNPVNIDELLVVTFTRAAADQMKDKIEKAIENMLEQEPNNEHFLNQMNYIHQANILTIDSFCYQVVRENFYVLGIDPGIRVGETGEIGLLRQEILEQVIEEFYEKNSDFIDFSDAYSADKNDMRIEEYIEKVYDISASYPRPEEWTKQARAALHIESEEAFCQLPYVQRYFGELHGSAEGIKEKIEEMLKLVRQEGGPLYMEKAILVDIVLIDDILSARTYSQLQALTQIGFANIGRAKKGEEYDKDIAERIKKQRDDYKKKISALLAAFTLPFDVIRSQFAEQEAKLCALLDITDVFRERFKTAKLEKNILEFSDVEHFALQILCKEYDENGNPVPSDVAMEMAEGFREILIDEYQDSNYLQEAILTCVSKVRQGKNNLFMVGDVKQSIYSFRMARPDLFMEKYNTYGTDEGAPCRKLLLKNNFRSRGNLLQGINYIFFQIMGADLGGIDYTDTEALVPGREFPPVEDDSVELLLGESKDFEFLSLHDEEMTQEKNENLDEDLEDIGKLELEAEMIARRILELVESGKGTVVDEDTGKLRNARFGDIVILLRSPNSIQQIFAEVLLNHGIPVRLQNEKGYFDSVEIRLVLSLLRMLDNRYNDLEVTAVLRSYFGRFHNDELAILMLIKRELEKNMGQQQYVYSVVEALAGYSDELQQLLDTLLVGDLAKWRERIVRNIVPKCGELVGMMKQIDEWREFMTVEQLLYMIYEQTGYYYYVEAMPEGKRRVRNLDLFMEEAKRFSSGSFHSVFHFLRFIDRLQEKSISLGGEPAAESEEDVVRMMSIHKSKGLEFPIVFLSGTGKNFNLMDTKAPLIIHSDYFIGARYVDTRKRCGNNTFSRRVFGALMLTESIAEELRILYVGLTRAKEKLMITGVTPDIPKLVHKYDDVAMKSNVPLSFSVVHTAKSYLDLIVAALMRNESFYQAMQQVRKRLDKKGEEIRSAEYEKPFLITVPDFRLRVRVSDFRNLAVHHIQSGLDREAERGKQTKQWESLPALYQKQIEENLAWKYREELSTKQKSKMSVTEIKRIYETDYEPSDVIRRPSRDMDSYTPPVPAFLGEKRPMDAAERGTWVHKTMELLDFSVLAQEEQVREALVALWDSGRIPEETKDFITPDKIAAFIHTELGKRVCAAARRGEFYKEKQFVAGVDAQQIVHKEIEGTVVVQGIIDAYFREGDQLVLIDYKTDYIRPGQEEILRERYKTQLFYYKDTLEHLTGLAVSESYLYSFALDKEIKMF
ncbi:MAG: helicase-exonuclease AddAB subunit AddA [Clostridium sp.]|nr:helicase-exonuclease AddAB subunit AddA [Clostridium sp.]